MWRCWTLPILRFDRETMQLVYDVILLNKILRNHFLSENMQWNYASFNVSLVYLMHNIMEFFVTSSLTESKSTVLRRRLFSNEKIYLVKMYLLYTKSWASIADMFAVRYLWVVWEDKCCVVTQRAASDIRVAWLVYVRMYYVPIATLNQNKRTRLLYLGDAQIIMTFSLPPPSS